MGCTGGNSGSGSGDAIGTGGGTERVSAHDDLLYADYPVNCLACHAMAGWGDGVKRGDLSLAIINNADSRFDVHMNIDRSDLD